MKFDSPEKIKKALREAGASPRKRWGQNFLLSEKTVKGIARAARLSPGDTVLEVGPGLGALTGELIRRTDRVVAVEKDPRLAAYLAPLFEEGVRIVEGDILKKMGELDLGEDYKVVSNLPFNISKITIRKLLEAENPPRLLVLLLQKGVAESAVSRPPEADLFGTCLRFYGRPEYLKTVPRHLFWPQPEVEGAVLRIKDVRPRSEKEEDIFFSLLRAGFHQKRKQIKNSLSSTLGLEKEKVVERIKKADLSPALRPQRLEVDDWLRLGEEIEGLAAED